ncbi:hypothetical protein OPQ81_011309 [Rhizoctonia solani]|nr:hypothetical protein OPQ81_011309 [Rhizoctonia solani]
MADERIADIEEEREEVNRDKPPPQGQKTRKAEESETRPEGRQTPTKPTKTGASQEELGEYKTPAGILELWERARLEWIRARLLSETKISQMMAGLENKGKAIL